MVISFQIFKCCQSSGLYFFYVVYVYILANFFNNAIFHLKYKQLSKKILLIRSNKNYQLLVFSIILLHTILISSLNRIYNLHKLTQITHIHPPNNSTSIADRIML